MSSSLLVNYMHYSFYELAKYSFLNSVSLLQCFQYEKLTFRCLTATKYIEIFRFLC